MPPVVGDGDSLVEDSAIEVAKGEPSELDKLIKENGPTYLKNTEQTLYSPQDEGLILTKDARKAGLVASISTDSSKEEIENYKRQMRECATIQAEYNQADYFIFSNEDYLTEDEKQALKLLLLQTNSIATAATLTAKFTELRPLAVERKPNIVIENATKFIADNNESFEGTEREEITEKINKCTKNKTDINVNLLKGTVNIIRRRIFKRKLIEFTTYLDELKIDPSLNDAEKKQIKDLESNQPPSTLEQIRNHQAVLDGIKDRLASREAAQKAETDRIISAAKQKAQPYLVNPLLDSNVTTDLRTRIDNITTISSARALENDLEILDLVIENKTRINIVDSAKRIVDNTELLTDEREKLNELIEAAIFDNNAAETLKKYVSELSSFIDTRKKERVLAYAQRVIGNPVIRQQEVEEINKLIKNATTPEGIAKLQEGCAQIESQFPTRDAIKESEDNKRRIFEEREKTVKKAAADQYEAIQARCRKLPAGQQKTELEGLLTEMNPVFDVNKTSTQKALGISISSDKQPANDWFALNLVPFSSDNIMHPMKHKADLLDPLIKSVTDDTVDLDRLKNLLSNRTDSEPKIETVGRNGLNTKPIEILIKTLNGQSTVHMPLSDSKSVLYLAFNRDGTIRTARIDSRSYWSDTNRSESKLLKPIFERLDTPLT